MQIKIIGINNTFANNFCGRLDRKGKNSAMKTVDKIKSGIAMNREAKPLKSDAYTGSDKQRVASEIKSLVIVVLTFDIRGWRHWRLNPRY